MQEDSAHRDSLFAAVYDSLYQRAQALMRNQPPGHTLQATALVNEVYLRFSHLSEANWNDRTHLLSTAASAMRQILVDHARRKRAGKRCSTREQHDLDQIVLAYQERSHDLEKLDQALLRLDGFAPEMRRVVELRFFAGRSMEEIAEILDLSTRTLERKWCATRAWLHEVLR